jgi:hypothetical protein
MPTESIKVHAFLCSRSQGAKTRVTFHGIVPTVGAHIQIGQKLFKVVEIVHPLNSYEDGLHGDRAIELFVQSEGGNLYAEAESYEEIGHTEFHGSGQALTEFYSK